MSVDDIYIYVLVIGVEMMWIFVLADHKIHPTKKNRLQNLNEFGKEGRT